MTLLTKEGHGKKLKWKQLARSVCLVVSRMPGRRKEASKQTKALGVRLSPFLPAQIEFLFKAFPNKGEELSTATAR